MRYPWLFVVPLSALALASSCVDRADDGAFGAPDGGAGGDGPGGGGPDATATGDAGGAGDGGDAADAPTAAIPPTTTPLASGGLSNCAIAADGGAVCWGDNQHGALGVGDFTPDTSAAPLAVTGLTAPVRAVAGGPFAQCAILVDGTAWCWGDSLFGDVNGATAHVQVPYPQNKNGLANDVAQIAFGVYFACALTTSGRAKCWGLGGAGQLGIGTTDDSYIAHDVAGVTEPLVWVSPSMGGLFACAATLSGKALCWGENGAQQLGTGDTKAQSSPVPVVGLDAKASAVGAGRAHACALLEDGGIACWGDDSQGQMGRGTTSATPAAPMRVNVTKAKSLVVGGDHACALVESGSVVCWGSGSVGQITGTPAGPVAPTEAAPASFGAIAVGAGLMHTCVMSAARHVTCVGDASRKQTGTGDFSL